jgi:lysophospholipase L1-like esterase
MANALTTFKNAGTEVVMIMLGVNDSETDLETYKADIQSIINQLKAGGISKIILNQPTYATYKGSVFSQYIDVLKELVDEEYVFL